MSTISPSDSDAGGGKAEAPLLKTLDISFTERAGVKAFDNVSLEDYYKPIDDYEGRHRWDPEFVWEAKEEKRVVRKVYSVLFQCAQSWLTLSDRPSHLHMGVGFS